ncbi:glycoside hydrolase family 99-like domain-containing protein [Vibrio cyclitrophicus]
MKVLAYYLPQFHEVSENNKWWGQGFTEWTNVRNAKPLYDGHIQPRIPLNNNYYDLLSVSALKWQAKLLHDYNIYGLCYYHYWFEGRKILESPAELLLANHDIEQRFCFCWANHDWRRTWNSTNELLINQGYGDESEWVEHLEYLMPFFKDSRYIKVNNRPVFVVYNLATILRAKERFEFYSNYLKENGFDGIELIQSVNNYSEIDGARCSANVVLREPSFTHFSTESVFKKFERKLKSNKSFSLFSKPRMYSFSEISNKSISYNINHSVNDFEGKIYLGAFGGWDSTPRHGKHGYIISQPYADEFKAYLDRLQGLISSNEKFSDIVFYNAWNEWGEGCYLEPDCNNEYLYLDVVAKFSDEA